MKIRNTLALVATSLIACSANVNAQASCANLPGMMLTIKQYHIDLNDNRPVCISAPAAGTSSVFKIKIVNPSGGGHIIQPGDVTVEQKVAEADAAVLISGDNQDDKLELEVEVERGPQWPPAEGVDEFEFWIKVKKVGKLDPRIRVIGSNELIQLQIDAVDAALDSWNLSYEEFDAIRREFGGK